MNSFKVNDFLTVRLEQKETVIYVKDKRFINCKYLLLSVPIEEMTRIEDLRSLDEISDSLDKSMEYESLLLPETVPLIPPEVEFWGHCSNLQVWYENDYSTGLLHSNIAFPLLRKLCDAGDPLANKVFAEEIARRFDSEYLPVMMSLLVGGYLFYLSPEQLESLKIFTKLKTADVQKQLSLGRNSQPQILEAFVEYLTDFKAKTVNEWVTKAKMLRAFKMDEKSSEIFHKAMEQFPDNEELLLAYMRDLNERGRAQEAIQCMQTLTEIAPQKPIYWFGLGKMMINENQIEKAIAYLEKALEINPKITMVKMQLAEAYHVTQRYVKRDNLIMEYYEKGDLKLPLLRDFALFSSAIGKAFYAIPLLKKVLYLNPNDVESWFALALSYKGSGKQLHQRRCLRKVKSLSTDPFLTSDALNLLGLAYIEREKWRFKKGLECFQEAVQLNPENETAWANQTPVLAMLLDTERAHIALEISQKIKELREESKLGLNANTAPIKRVLEELKDTYWNAPFTCPFCKAETAERPSTCPSCGGNLDAMLKGVTKSKEQKGSVRGDRKEAKPLALKSPKLEDEAIIDTYKKFANQEKNQINFTLPKELFPEKKGLRKMFWPSLDFGHTIYVESLAVSPDGRYLASGSNEIKLWDLEKNCFVRTMKGHTGLISSISFHEGVIVSSSWDSSIRIWDIATGKQLCKLQTPKNVGVIHCFQALLTSDGLIIAELSEGNAEYPDWIEVWDLRTRKLVNSIETGFDQFHSLCLLPDEKAIAGITEWENIGIIDLTNGRVVKVFEGLVDEPGEFEESDYLTYLTMTPDKKYFLTRSELGITKKIDAHTGKISFSKQMGGRYWMKILGNGKLAIAQGYNVAILNPYSLELEDTLIGPTPDAYHRYIRGMVLTPDRKRLICGFERQIGVWDFQRGDYLGSLGGLKFRCSTSLVKDDLALTLVNDNIFLWDVFSGAVIKQSPIELESPHLYASPKGNYFINGISTSYKTSVKLWNLKSLTQVAKIGDYYVSCFNRAGTLFAATPNTDSFLAFGREEKEKGMIVIFEIPSLRIISSFKIHSDLVGGIAFSPDNIHIASSSNDESIKIWNYRTGEITLTIESYSRGRPLAYSPDGKSLIEGSSWRGSSNITFWNAMDGKEIRKIKVGRNFCHFAFTSDCEYFASGGKKKVYIWNFAKALSFGPFKHLSSVNQIEFIDDDKVLMVIDDEGRVYLWDYLKGIKTEIELPQNC